MVVEYDRRDQRRNMIVQTGRKLQILFERTLEGWYLRLVGSSQSIGPFESKGQAMTMKITLKRANPGMFV